MPHLLLEISEGGAQFQTAPALLERKSRIVTTDVTDTFDT